MAAITVGKTQTSIQMLAPSPSLPASELDWGGCHGDSRVTLMEELRGAGE